MQNIKKAISEGRFHDAITLADEAMPDASKSQQVELTYLQVVAKRLSGQLVDAIQLANSLILRSPQHGRAHQELGYLWHRQGEFQQAAIAFHKAVQHNPALLASWKQLRDHHKRAGHSDAVKLADQQIQFLESLPREILGARDLMYEGELLKADQICRRYLQRDKHHKEAICLLAEIGIELRIYGEAEFLLESCLALYPDYKAAAMIYLKLLSKMGKFAKAEALADQFLSSTGNDLHLKVAKATAQVGIGKIDEAIETYQALLQHNPQQPNIHLLLGHAFKAAGHFPQAISAYQSAYRHKPDFGDAFWSLANTKTYRFCEAELTQMKGWISNQEAAQDDKIHMLFALGKASEDAGVYEQAFDFYAQGNALKQQQLGYRPEFVEKQVDGQIEFCSKALFESSETWGDPRPDPIFIVGLPRAGSTLLEQILASHSLVDGTMELHDVLGLASRLRGQSNRYPKILSELAPDYFKKFGAQYLQDTQVYRGAAPFFVDKMPNNFLHIGLIKLILPNAKIIDARRNPMACCFSGFKQLFGEGQEFSYDLTHLGHYYRQYVRMMEHWNEVLPGAILTVQHEQVIDDLEGQVRRILEYCGLPFEQSCLEFYQTNRTIKTPSSEQVRQPINPNAMNQWKHFEPFLEPLKLALGDVVQSKAVN